MIEVTDVWGTPAEPFIEIEGPKNELNRIELSDTIHQYDSSWVILHIEVPENSNRVVFKVRNTEPNSNAAPILGEIFR